MKKCIEAQAQLSVQVKLLVNEVQPLKSANTQLRTEVKQLQYKLFKQEMTTVGVGILSCIVLFFVARRALQIKYKKEFQFEIAGKKYEEKYQSGMDSTSGKSELSEKHRVHEKKESSMPSGSALSDARRARRERMVRDY